MARRVERVAEAIRRLASEIVHSQLRDPRMRGLITITKVEMTPDLRLAKIYYTVLGDEKKKKLAMKGLKSAKNFIRKRIGDELELRYAPDILLRIDEALEYSQKIDAILSKLERDKTDAENRKNSKNDQGL